NMDHNALAYARQPFERLYGDLEERFRAVAAPVTGSPLQRIWAPYDTPGFGPLNGPLDNRIAVTFGYNPLSLNRYNRYLELSNANSKLLDSLAVTAKLNKDTGVFESNSAALPRIYAPPTVLAAAGPEEA